MATQSTIYDLEATDIRFFLSTKPIASKSHVAIWIKGDDDVYRIQNEADYELINDNIVYPTHPSGKALEVRVGDEPSDLVNAPTDISIVSAIANEIVIVADNVQDVITVADNITQVTIVSDNMTELLVISTDIDQVLLSKEYAVNPEDVAITDNPTDFSSLHHASKSKASAEEAQTIVDSVNFPAGLIMEWHSDRKPSGWLWCDGESYSVFSPTPTFAYDELYQVLVDPAYVMTTKPEDWDINYPDDPNGWYDPSFPASVVTQAELDLLVLTPDRRGLFVRGKDQAGSVIPARGLDSHGVVDLDVVTPSQNKSHTHDVYAGTITGNGSTDDTGSASPDAMADLTTTSEGGDESHPTYGTTNYVIRAKGSYNGDGSGSGGTGIVPIASEIEYDDIPGSGNSNLQDTTDDMYDKEGIIRIDGAPQIVVTEDTVHTSGVMGDASGAYSGYNLAHYNGNKYKADGYTTRTATLRRIDVGSIPIVTTASAYSTASAFDAHNGTWTSYDETPNEIYIKDIESGSTLHTISRAMGDADACFSDVLNDTYGTKSGTALNIYTISTNTLIESITFGVDGTRFEAVPLFGGGYAFHNISSALNVWTEADGMQVVVADASYTLPTNTTARMVQDGEKTYIIGTGTNAKIFEVTLNKATGVTTLVAEHTALEQADTRFGISISGTEVTYCSGYTYIGAVNAITIVSTTLDAERVDAYVNQSNKDTVTDTELGRNSLTLSDGGQASGNNSTVMGEGTKSLHDNQLVLGEFNDTTNDAVLSIGNGTDDETRSTSVEINKDGSGATDTIAGVAKYRLDGTVLYITIDGTDA